jgi:hypothetical protein
VLPAWRNADVGASSSLADKDAHCHCRRYSALSHVTTAYVRDPAALRRQTSGDPQQTRPLTVLDWLSGSRRRGLTVNLRLTPTKSPHMVDRPEPETQSANSGQAAGAYISYASQDKAVADAVCQTLERTHRCCRWDWATLKV